jgi:nicotinate phosphoribosyltransferase
MPSHRHPLDAFTLEEEDLSLATDLYQLTMAAAYREREELPRGTFELFVRRLPEARNFLVLAGIDQALASLRALRFSADQIDYLRALPPFERVPDAFFEMLRRFEFRGDAWAMREGTIFFPHEPVLRITGNLIEAQVVETLLLSIVNFQTTIASKAARIRLAAGPDLGLAEFGSRRAHGPQAAAWAARAAYVGGFDSTSNVLTGMRSGIPVVGTMAHSFIMSFDDESEAFRAYHRLFPEHTTFLVDTYDTLEGVRRALDLNLPFNGIRIDSGDFAVLARQARQMLDQGGREEAQIFISGDMDEWKIARLLEAKAPIDAFGVGTRVATSSDSPALGGIYKLVEVEEGGVATLKFKSSVGKTTYPGKKQVMRSVERDRLRGDRIVPLEEAGKYPRAEPLLRPVMRGGEILETPPLVEARDHCRRQLAALPPRIQGLRSAEEPYPVSIDDRLEVLLIEERERAVGG